MSEVDHVSIELADKGDECKSNAAENVQEQIIDEGFEENEKQKSREQMKTDNVHSPSCLARLMLIFSCKCKELSSFQEKRILSLSKPSTETWFLYHHHLICLILASGLLLLLHYSTNYPWFGGMTTTKLKQASGEPFHVHVEIYLDHYTAEVIEFQGLSMGGSIDEFNQRTQDIIKLAEVAYHIIGIVTILTMIEKFTLGLFFQLRRTREKRLAEGRKKFFCLSTENPSPHSFVWYLENAVQRYTFSKVFRWTFFSIDFLVALFSIICVFILYPLQMLWQASNSDAVPSGSKLLLINLSPENLQCETGWYLLVAATVVWIGILYFRFNFSTISTDLLHHIEDLHGPWEIQKLAIDPLVNLTLSVRRSASSVIKSIARSSSSSSSFSKENSGFFSSFSRAFSNENSSFKRESSASD